MLNKILLRTLGPTTGFIHHKVIFYPLLWHEVGFQTEVIWNKEK